jgi:hypothetical protein
MRFMSLWRPAQTSQAGTAQMAAEMGKLIEDMSKAGVLVLTGGWSPTSPCTLLTNSKGKVTVTDGPYTEAKEVIAGFAVFDVKSKAEAIEWCQRFLRIAGDGTSEMRELGGPAN